ncbi:hypothetical protein ABEF95_005029 [Exophiala dermatitidis]
MTHLSRSLQALACLVPCFIMGALAHRPHVDDGTHTSIANAWEFPDTTIARVYLTYFDCPSVAVWTKVNITNTTAPLTVGVGIPNATAQLDYRPSLWAIGQNLIIPDDYQNDSDRNVGVSQVAKGPRVPRGYTAIEYPSEGSTVWQPFREEAHDESGYGFLRAKIQVSQPGMVYLVLQPLENRRARAFISMGTDETAAKEAGSPKDVDYLAWFSETSLPRLGEYCEPWSE